MVETREESRISIRTKLEVVKRLLQGSTLISVAADFGVRPEVAECWRDRFVGSGAKAIQSVRPHSKNIPELWARNESDFALSPIGKAFLRAGRRSLGHEFGPGEIPTLEEIEDIAQRGFPSEHLQVQSAAAFFAARFYGKNDVIHLCIAGVPYVHCVDTDTVRLEIMRKVYPEKWSYDVGDAYALARRFREEGRIFDVTIADCPNQMALRVLFADFENFIGITRQHLFCYFNREMFNELGIQPTAESLGRRLSDRWQAAIVVEQLALRSSAYGGTYWAIVRAPGHR